MGGLSANFSRWEFACKCKCGFDAVDVELLGILIDLRDHFNAKVNISSGCRCANLNSLIGGSARSFHLLGKAADIVVEGRNPQMVVKYLNSLFPDKYGIGTYPTHTHIDIRRNKARWYKT